MKTGERALDKRTGRGLCAKRERREVVSLQVFADHFGDSGLAGARDPANIFRISINYSQGE